MLGSSDSYPYKGQNNPNSAEPYKYPNFPHEASLMNATRIEKLKSLGIVLREVKVINPNDDDFCILTMDNYVDFTADIAPLCLPEFPNSNYNEVNVKMYGFGYESSYLQKNGFLHRLASHEKNGKYALEWTRENKVHNTKVISRHECHKLHAGRDGKIPAKHNTHTNPYLSSPLKLDMYGFTHTFWI